MKNHRKTGLYLIIWLVDMVLVVLFGVFILKPLGLSDLVYTALVAFTTLLLTGVLAVIARKCGVLGKK